MLRTVEEKTVIYTCDGEFLEIAAPGESPPVGQVLDVSPVPPVPFYRRPFLKFAAAAAALVVALLLGIVYPLAGPGPAVASVALDINTGIELMINRESKVIQTRSAGEGPDLILSNLDLKGLNVYEAIERILEEARARGVFGNARLLVLASVVLKNDESSEVINVDKLRCTIYEDLASGKVPGLIVVSEADESKKRQAESHNMTLNSYLVYERCRLCNLDIQADSFREGGAAKALEGTRVSLPCLFPGESLELKREDLTRRTEAGGGGSAGSPCGCDSAFRGHEPCGDGVLPAPVTGKDASRTTSQPDCGCQNQML